MRGTSEEVRSKKYIIAENAIRDILYMYYVCVDYNGLFDDFGTEDGDFDPFYFIDCSVDKVGYELNYKLLHEGSAIKISCQIMQAWGQGGYTGIKSKGLERIKSLVKSERVDHIPELKAFIELALISQEKAEEKSKEIYDKYVLGRYRAIANGNT